VKKRTNSKKVFKSKYKVYLKVLITEIILKYKLNLMFSDTFTIK